MLARNMLYDAANYVMQVEEIVKEHREKRDLKKDEYLSGFAKDDKLLPVIIQLGFILILTCLRKLEVTMQQK